MTGVLAVVGDALCDRDLTGRAERLAPDAPVPVVDSPVERSRPGGAALAAALAAGDGREVVLVTALGADAAGDAVHSLLAAAGVRVLDLGLAGRTPEKVRVLADGRPLVRLDYGDDGAPVGALHDEAAAAVRAADAVLVSDYGRGVAASGAVRKLLAAVTRRSPVVWDPHPRGPAPVAGVRLATPNRAEARRAVPDVAGEDLRADAARAAALVARWAAAGVAITRGAEGALLVGADGSPLAVPAARVRGGDPCGAGDRFAATAAGCLADGALPSEAVAEAVAAATAFVAGGGAGAWSPPGEHDSPATAGSGRRDAQPHAGEASPAGAGGEGGLAAARALIERVRAAGGTVVATGGCFDLLHAGHVRVLEAARALGDCLVVCLNSDASVRGLKGAGRPLVPAADRAAVLRALGSVDAVVVFDEDTPEVALAQLRPDVWAKGADYAVADLPEAALVASWGGQAVVLPYLPGRSTTQLILEASTRARP